ncbi:polyadenylate-binding protein-interacting protein 5 [Daucus carota subsp. sativus]|uniref:polyadenylate-binding protein-interacting protein 5 n=1 Tax=Daucus carota subsp. sativus TaxID=79200 RepID=UPI0007F040A9|nr:PREDICTED: polyadenylate-binding protein-interacting protein 5-like [Daucus carota subsp. sativus]
MKGGTSSLNPYAASYIPLSRRGISDGNKDFEITTSASKIGDEGLKPASATTHNQYQMAPQSCIQEKHKSDDDSDMDLTYLQMTFPGVSDDSLSDVYLINKGDLDATVDMLNQLELYPTDYSENLPDTLDIGDVAESGSSVYKLKDVSKSEVGGSSTAGTQPLSS